MSQDRRRPQQLETIIDPTDERRLRLVTHAEVKPAKKDSARLAAEVMALLRNHGLDCSDAVEALEDEPPPTLH